VIICSILCLRVVYRESNLQNCVNRQKPNLNPCRFVIVVGNIFAELGSRRLTTGRDMSPSMFHKSAIVISPTSKTTKSPTNFTEMQQANMVPVKPSQSHQGVENSASRVDETFTAPSTEPIMKHNRIGSKRMYWVRVSIPTSVSLSQ
jgi:hypothetical protein